MSRGSVNRLLGYQFFQYALVDFRELVQCLHGHTFIDLVNSGIDRPEFEYLCAGGRNKTAVRGTSTGRQFGVDTGDL